MKTPWGEIEIGPASDIRAYDETGRCFSFTPIEKNGWLYAIDIEPRELDGCGFVSSALGAGGLASWVEVEVVAKLSNTPAHLIFRQFKAGRRVSILQYYQVEVLRSDTDSHWIAIGRSRNPYQKN